MHVCVGVCECGGVYVYVRVCVCGRQRQRKRETEEEETLEGKSKNIPCDSNCPRMKNLLLLTAADWDGFDTQRDGDAGVRTVWFH